VGDDERVPATVEAALARIEGSLGAGFAELRGQIALVLQRADQSDARLRELADTVAAHEGRIRVQETTAATREDVKALGARIDVDVKDLDTRIDGAVTQEQMDARFRRTTTILTLVLTVAGMLVAAGTSVLIAVLL
jgi:hypothetical protein